MKCANWITCTFAWIGWAAAFAQQPAPRINSNLKAGDKVVEGDCVPDGACDVKLLVNGEEAKLSLRFADPTRARFRLELAAALKGGDSVKAQQTISGQASLSEEVKIAQPPAEYVDLELPIREGADEIRGTTSAGVKAVRIYVLNADLTKAPVAAGCEQLKKAKTEPLKLAATLAYEGNVVESVVSSPELIEAIESQESVAVKDKAFKINLKQPIADGQYVVAVNERDGQPDWKTQSVLVPVQTVQLRWGRARGIFSFGATIGRNNSKLQTAPHVGFYGEGFVFNSFLDKTDEEGCPLGQVKFSGFGSSLMVFTDVRLTQTVTKDSAGVESRSSTSGQSHVGLYLPLRWKGLDWMYRGKLYSWHAGPLLKLGATLPEGGVLVRSTVAVDKDGKEKLTGETRRNGAMPFASAGLRVGFSRYDLLSSPNGLRNRQMSPDPISYFDITYGPYTQYRNYTVSTIAGAADTATRFTESKRHNRLAVEGRLKLPAIPAQVGFDVNIAARGRLDEEPNDWRVFIGYRIDAARALGRVFPNAWK